MGVLPLCGGKSQDNKEVTKMIKKTTIKKSKGGYKVTQIKKASNVKFGMKLSNLKGGIKW